LHILSNSFGHFGFFNIITRAVIAAAGSNIARILLVIIATLSSLVPGEDGNGSKMLGGD
jgi:hypothetical protein